MVNLSVVLYAASKHASPEVLQEVARLRQSHHDRPSSRVALAACGRANPEVIADEVRNLLEAIGHPRRYADRFIGVDEMEDWFRSLLIGAGNEIALVAPLAPAGGLDVAEEILAGQDPGGKIWMAEF